MIWIGVRRLVVRLFTVGFTVVSLCLKESLAMLTRGHFVCHVHCLVHDGVVWSSPCGPHHENFGRNLYHMFCFVCGSRVASKSSVDSIPFLSGVLILLCEYQSFLIIEIVMSILFQTACFSSSGSDHFNIRKIKYQFFSTVFVSSVQSCLCFSRPPIPFSSRIRIS